MLSWVEVPMNFIDNLVLLRAQKLCIAKQYHQHFALTCLLHSAFYIQTQKLSNVMQLLLCDANETLSEMKLHFGILYDIVIASVHPQKHVCLCVLSLSIYSVLRGQEEMQ